MFSSLEDFIIPKITRTKTSIGILYTIFHFTMYIIFIILLLQSTLNQHFKLIWELREYLVHIFLFCSIFICFHLKILVNYSPRRSQVNKEEATSIQSSESSDTVWSWCAGTSTSLVTSTCSNIFVFNLASFLIVLSTCFRSYFYTKKSLENANLCVVTISIKLYIYMIYIITYMNLFLITQF